MKAISIRQPWASLILLRAKLIETRGWKTDYRGPILIHASQSLNDLDRRLIATEPFSFHIQDPDSLPLGAIIGKADLVAISRSESLKGKLTIQEEAFGDYSAGRYGWHLENPVMYDTPIPCKGQLRIWNVPEELVNQINQIHAADTTI